MKQLGLFMSLLLATTLNTHAQPIVNLFELGVQANKTADFNTIGHHNISESVTGEAGTLAMYSFKLKPDSPSLSTEKVSGEKSPNISYMFEVYQDETAYQQHLKSPQYQRFIKNSSTILTAHKHKVAVTPQFLGDKKVIQTDQTINNLVMVDVKPEANERFRQIVIPEMQQSLKVENGVLAMYAVTQQDMPNRWYFYEIYASEEAYQSHRQTAHFLDYLKQSKELITDKNVIGITPNILLNKGNLQFIRN